MKCANPLCESESIYFRSGSLHCIDRGQASRSDACGEQRQLIWLCRDCSQTLSVETWRPAGEQMRIRRVPYIQLDRSQRAGRAA